MPKKTNSERLAVIETSQLNTEEYIRLIAKNNVNQWKAISNNLKTCSFNKGMIWYVGAGMVVIVVGLVGLYV